MKTLTEETLYDEWTKKFQQSLQEHRLSILMELGEEAYNSLNNLRIINVEVEVDVFMDEQSITFSDGNQKIKYWAENFEQGEEQVHIENVDFPYAPQKTEDYLAKLLKSFGMNRLYSQWRAFSFNKKEFDAFFKEYDYAFLDILDANWNNHDKLYLVTKDADYLVVPAEARDDVANAVLRKKYHELYFDNPKPTEETVGELQKITGFSTSEILSFFSYAATYWMKPYLALEYADWSDYSNYNEGNWFEQNHLNEDEWLEYSNFRENNYFEKEKKERGYAHILGVAPFDEKQIGDFFIYRQR